VDEGHGHPNGGGAWWHDGYGQIFNDFKATARQANPDLVLSSEGMAETYIALLDSFWDPFTTCWSPNSVSAVFNDSSNVHLIPLWHAVYHDYAYLESGISFVSREGPTGAVGYGDYRDFYVRGFALSLVWGEMPVTWYADERMSALDEQAERNMADYLRRIVEARTGYAQPYLVYGRMLKPPVLNVPDFHINGAHRIPYTLDDYPPFDSPAVLASVWKASSGNVGYIFTNISHDTVAFAFAISPSEILLPGEDYYAVVQNRNGFRSTLLSGAHLPQTLAIQIEPLDVVLIEVSPSTLTIATNAATFRTGDSVIISVGVNNPGLATTVDFYFGAVLPDGDTVVFFTDLAFSSAVGRLSAPATLRPIVAGVDLRASFVFNQPSFFTYTWQGGEPGGSYVFFLAAVRPGGLADNSIDAGDIVALATAVVTFTP
jgi:hypothetical protein